MAHRVLRLQHQAEDGPVGLRGADLRQEVADRGRRGGGAPGGGPPDLQRPRPHPRPDEEQGRDVGAGHEEGGHSQGSGQLLRPDPQEVHQEGPQVHQEVVAGCMKICSPNQVFVNEF